MFDTYGFTTRTITAARAGAGHLTTIPAGSRVYIRSVGPFSTVVEDDNGATAEVANSYVR